MPCRAKMSTKAKQFRKRARSDSDDEGEGHAKAKLSAAAQRPTAASGVFATSVSTEQKSASSSMLAQASSGSSAPHAYGGGAFSTSDVNAADHRDERAAIERRIALEATAKDAIATIAAGGVASYRGLAGYGKSFMDKDAAEAVSKNKITGTQGPLRAPSNVRGICRVDYQPDVCKDYKETGYCGFGDSCKFLHDRGDYKSGWQIDQEWDSRQKAREVALAKAAAGLIAAQEAEEAGVDVDNPFLIRDEEGGGVDDDGLPFACFICRSGFVDPVQTQCGHYFCEGCALGRYKDDHTCAACSKPTHGIFNAAPKLNAKLRAAGRLRGRGGDEAGASSSSSARGGFVAVDDSDHNERPANDGGAAAASSRGASSSGWAAVDHDDDDGEAETG